MSMLVLLVLLIGAMLGIRYKVLILVPGIGLLLATVLAVGIIRGESAFTISMVAMLASSCLQIGYLCGTVAQQSKLANRGGNLRKVSLGDQPLKQAHAAPRSTDHCAGSTSTQYCG